MDLKILGTGCSKCKKLEEVTKAAADELGLQYNIEKVTEIEKMSTPALVVNGKVKVAGRFPSIEDLKKMLS